MVIPWVQCPIFNTSLLKAAPHSNSFLATYMLEYHVTAFPTARINGREEV